MADPGPVPPEKRAKYAAALSRIADAHRAAADMFTGDMSVLESQIADDLDRAASGLAGGRRRASFSYKRRPGD